MVLVTTALEETFPKDKNEKILFLGEWCKIYTRKSFYEKYDFQTLQYHWDDRKKLYEDTKYIDKVYEQYLELLKKNLNRIHNVHYSNEYWRIILGPWLRYLIEMVYDRYLSVIKALEYDIEYTICLKTQEREMVPDNMNEFSQYYSSDLWNHFIYNQILSFYKIDIKDTKSNTTLIDDSKSLKTSSAILMNMDNSIHFFNSYIKAPDLHKIVKELGELPLSFNELNILQRFNYSTDKREQFIFKDKSSDFLNILNIIIPKQIPKCYLEGYSIFKKDVLMQYPNNVKIIFTANSYSEDDAFKFWAAEKKEEGAKYIINQHGGHFGMGLFASYEEHQIKTADKFFSWGWQNKEYSNIVQVYPSKLKQKIGYNPKGDILIPLASFPRQSYHIMTMPIAGQTLYIIQNQIEYLKLASIDLYKLLKLRLHHHDYNWKFKNRLKDLGYSGCIDNNENLNKSFYDRLSECRLCISTYNATTYLETFSQNYPTLLYWNPSHWELRDEAKEYFTLLKDVGILHYTAESLLSKLEEIYNNPLQWWQEDKIQNAKNKFCKRFADTNRDLVFDFTIEINKLL